MHLEKKETGQPERSCLVATQKGKGYKKITVFNSCIHSSHLFITAPPETFASYFVGAQHYGDAK